MPSREEQKEQRRQDILLAALQLFVRRGYAATTINDIATAVPMSVGLLFHYFESKEALYLALVKIGRNGPEMVMTAPTNDPMKDPLGFLQEAAEMTIGALRMHPSIPLFFSLMTQALRSEATPESVREEVKKVDNISQCVPLIEQGQRLGIFREGDPLALSIAFWSAIQGTAESFAADPSLPLPEAEWFLDILKKPAEAIRG